MTWTKAKVARLTTLDGWDDIFNEYVAVGDPYLVDLNRIEVLRHSQHGRAGEVKRQFIWAAPSETGHEGWIPLEMLEIERTVLN